MDLICNFYCGMRYISCAQCTKLVHILSISFVTMLINLFYMCGLIIWELVCLCIFDLQFFFSWGKGRLGRSLELSWVIHQNVIRIFSCHLYSFCVDNQPIFWMIKCHWIYIYFVSFPFLSSPFFLFSRFLPQIQLSSCF